MKGKNQAFMKLVFVNGTTRYLLIKLQLTSKNKMIKFECHNFVTPNELIDPGIKAMAADIKKSEKPDVICFLMEKHNTSGTCPN